MKIGGFLFENYQIDNNNYHFLTMLAIIFA